MNEDCEVQNGLIPISALLLSFFVSLSREAEHCRGHPASDPETRSYPRITYIDEFRSPVQHCTSQNRINLIFDDDFIRSAEEFMNAIGEGALVDPNTIA